jgi:hypothetical protein
MDFFSSFGSHEYFQKLKLVDSKVGRKFLTNSFRFNAPNLYENLWFRV